MATETMPAVEEIGCRVQVLKDRATIRYIGNVRGQEGTWVGLEWDDASRGKHDGTTGGVQYFECASGTTSGSFVRIEKVSFGYSLMEAVTARYTGQRGELGDVDKSEMYVHTAQNRKVTIHLIGEQMIQTQQSQIQHLTSARVVGASVSHMVSASG
jgi:dynactin complex subunit